MFVIFIRCHDRAVTINCLNIFLKLHGQTKLDATVCSGQERQLLPLCFLCYLPLTHAVGDFGQFLAISFVISIYSCKLFVLFQESQLREMEKNLDKNQTVQQMESSCTQLHHLLSSLHKHIFSYCTICDQKVSVPQETICTNVKAYFWGKIKYFNMSSAEILPSMEC